MLMRTQYRNKQKIFYKKYLGYKEIENEQGEGTGQYVSLFSEPIEMKINFFSPISLGGGSKLSVEDLGLMQEYEQILVTTKKKNIKENDLFYIKNKPPQRPDYRVEKILDTLNERLIGLKKNNTGD